MRRRQHGINPNPYFDRVPPQGVAVAPRKAGGSNPTPATPAAQSTPPARRAEQSTLPAGRTKPPTSKRRVVIAILRGALGDAVLLDAPSDDLATADITTKTAIVAKHWDEACKALLGNTSDHIAQKPAPDRNTVKDAIKDYRKRPEAYPEVYPKRRARRRPVTL